jgi:membrane protease YdiL (CAAX protease family)
VTGRTATIERSGAAGGWAVVATGGALLLARPWIRGAGGTPALAVAFGVLAVLALAAPRGDAPAAPAMSPLMALLLGTTAAAAATLVAGPAPKPPLAASLVALNVGAAVAEEAFFRGALYGRLAPRGAAVAVVGSAVAFALIHVPLYGWALLPVDLGAGLVLSWQRWASGTWAVPAATHAFADVLAVLR